MPSVDLIPGHGGFDPGAVNSINGVRECDGNLAIALLLADILTQHGVTVHLSRNVDQACGGATTTAADVTNQINFANRSGADIAVAIHFNGAAASNATGSEVLFSQYPVYDPREVKLANLVLAEVVGATGLANRGIKQIDSGVSIIKKVNKPTILVECAFVTTVGESDWAAQPARQTVLAHAIAKGILKYFGIAYTGDGGGAVVDIEQALQIFVAKGIITDANYWRWACSICKYLDVVFIRVAQLIA